MSSGRDALAHGGGAMLPRAPRRQRSAACAIFIGDGVCSVSHAGASFSSGGFRVPRLRQLPHTTPCMHDGSLQNIDDVGRHHSELNQKRLPAHGERIPRPLNLAAGQAADLHAFLRSFGEPAPR